MRRLASIVPASFAVLAGMVHADMIAEWDFDAHNAQDASEVGTDYDLTPVGAGASYDAGYAIFGGDAADYLETVGPGGAAAFTVSLWVRTDTANQGSFQGLFSNNSGGSGVAFSWQIDNNGGTYRLAANSNPPGAVSIGTPTTGTWENIVVRKTGAGSDWWFNGVSAGSVATGNPGGLQNFRLGINRASDQAYAMDLDRVQVWDSVEDPAAIYAAGRVSGTPFNGATSDIQLAANWDEGLPTIVGALSTAKIGRGLTGSITTGTTGAQFSDKLWVGFGGTSGTLNVEGGDTRIGAASGDGIFVGVGHGSTGTVNIAEGAVLRAQGAAVRMQIGDNDGGTGSVTVAGELQNYKYFDVVDGRLTMMPTGVNNQFNSTDVSFFRANATLEYVIDGTDIGSILRANATGLNVNIDAAAQLAITLLGVPEDYVLGQQWTLMDYTSLSGEFAQGAAFTNGQGFEFEVDYGTGANDVMILTLVPEASTGLLGLLGCVFLLRRRR